MTDRSRTYRTQAVILRRRDVGDADRVLTVFTPDRGKLELIGKGIRKTTSRKAGHLETFTHVALVVVQARTWDLITEAAMDLVIAGEGDNQVVARIAFDNVDAEITERR